MKRLEIAIGGRVYPLKVEEDEVGTVMDTVDEINQKLLDLQTTYSKKDMQDCLSMTLLTYAVEKKKQKQDFDTQEIESKLSKMSMLLDTIIG
jgi:cell division protein ZapA